MLRQASTDGEDVMRWQRLSRVLRGEGAAHVGPRGLAPVLPRRVYGQVERRADTQVHVSQRWPGAIELDFARVEVSGHVGLGVRAGTDHEVPQGWRKRERQPPADQVGRVVRLGGVHSRIDILHAVTGGSHGNDFWYGAGRPGLDQLAAEALPTGVGDDCRQWTLVHAEAVDIDGLVERARQVRTQCSELGVLQHRRSEVAASHQAQVQLASGVEVALQLGFQGRRRIVLDHGVVGLQQAVQIRVVQPADNVAGYDHEAQVEHEALEPFPLQSGYPIPDPVQDVVRTVLVGVYGDES